ncbi:MAG TPA: cobyric acid synthase [Epulopiscium sp.]|nr:cobyric acid synthase [Candidatus Epulonipiscium sp.]
MAKLMLQGTGSSVGKSILVSALCRILKQDGYSVCPYKSQNMGLNSYITIDGKEIGRAQVLQAYAAGLKPQAYMNPILLKPTGDKKCQVIVNGELYADTTAMGYHELKPQFSQMLKDDFEKIEKQFDIVIMEGAGSPAEINLRDRDIVNMGMAELVDAPVILVGDIDKGGVFASLAGTMLLLREQEKPRVKGTIINKFRGDIKLLEPGLVMLEDIIHIPTLGVVPYFNLQLEDEDGAITYNKEITAPIDIAVIHLSNIANFTDLDALEAEEDVSVRFVKNIKEFKTPDIVIIPSSRNLTEDLKDLQNNGLGDMIKAYSQKGILIGIGSGYQMLGKTIKAEKELVGLGLLDIHTVIGNEKTTTHIEGAFMAQSVKGKKISGYEVHMGTSDYGKEAKAFLQVTSKNGVDQNYHEGCISEKGNIIGTYIHGIFDGVHFREYLLNQIRKGKGLPNKVAEEYDHIREKELDKLADIVRNGIDMDEIYKIIFQKQIKKRR